MPRSYRFALRPGWLVGHLLVLAAGVTMVLLGRWQLNVSDAKHFNLQNFGYALQWWSFTIFLAVLWVKIIRDGSAPARSHLPEAGAGDAPSRLPAASAENPVAYRRYVMPQSSSTRAPAGDAIHAAYNDYLASLAGKSPAPRPDEGTAG